MMTRFLTLASVTLLLLVATGCPSTGIVCREGTDRCGNGCADYQADVRNCGACGKACLQGQVCASAACICQAGTSVCDGLCTVLETDPTNCGTCGHRCGVTEVCEQGSCGDSCVLGTSTRCGNSCVNLNDDPLNCGGCGVACTAPQSCRHGQCGYELVAACFSTGQMAGVQASTGLRGPLMPAGSGPAALGSFGGSTLLALDGIDRRLYQASLFASAGAPPLSMLAGSNHVGAVANHLLVDGRFIYVVNAESATLQVLQSLGPDAGCPAPQPVDAGCVGPIALSDGGQLQPTFADGGCVTPGPSDGGCFAVSLDDGGSGTLPLSDGGCFIQPPVPMAPPSPCSESSDAGLPAGVQLLTVAELNFGANTYPQAVAKTGNTLWVPLYGGFGAVAAAAGQKVIKVDVTNPSAPVVSGAVDLSGLDLKLFDPDGGPSSPRPYGVTAQGDDVYVPLNNLDPDTYAPKGPGLVVKVSGSSLVSYDLGDVCLNPVWVLPVGNALAVSCGGRAVYTPPTYALTAVDKAAVVLLDPVTGSHTGWAPRCPADAGLTDGGTSCPLILPSRFTVQGSSLYVGDQNAGRLFVLEAVDGGLVERRGYFGSAGGPVQACSVSSLTGISNVSDVLAAP